MRNCCRNRLSTIIRKREGQEAYEQHAMTIVPDYDQARQAPSEATDDDTRQPRAIGKSDPRDPGGSGRGPGEGMERSFD